MPPCVAVPLEQATPGAYCACGCGGVARVPDADWLGRAGTHCYQGFVRNERFGGLVIPPKPRKKGK